MTLLFGKSRFLQEWKLGVFAGLFFPFLVFLGCWQLQRAEQKDLLLAEYAARQQAAPLDATALLSMTPDQLRYRRAHIEGEFDPEKIFVLENRAHENRRGVEVIGVFHASDGQHYLVNRGWQIESNGQPRQLSAGVGKIQIIGDIYIPETPFAAGEWSVEDHWPKHVPVLDIAKIVIIGNENFFPGLIRLSADSPAVMTPNWDVVVSVTPLKHRAYAVQWFTMAAVLLVLYIVAVTRRNVESGLNNE